MNAPRVSVVIPCYRHAGLLRRCLEGVAWDRQGDTFETIVVNIGADPVVAGLAAEFPGVRLVASAERLWPGAARNRGARAAQGELLLFLDADCVPEPGWVRAATAALETGARLVGGPVLDLLPNHPIAVSDNLLQFAEYPADRPEGPVTKFPGCSLAIRRTDFEALGGFPEQLRMGEDTRFSTAALARWPGGLHFARAMRARHRGRTGLRDFITHQTWLGYARGLLGSDLAPSQRRLAEHAVMAPAVALKRLSYILGCTLRWHPTRVPAAVALTPLLAMGLLGYAVGLRRGLRHGVVPQEPW
ncbi:MAG: glycosyltransferase [Gemmatimonadales bacterium]